MPPKRKVPSGKAKARAPVVDSSDEEIEAARAEVYERRNKPVFSKQAIYDHIYGHGAKTVQHHVPSFADDPHVRADWARWLKETPESLAAVPPAARPLPLAMPMKCEPAGAQPDKPEARSTEQVELITYDDRERGGDVFNRSMRAYDAKFTRALVEGMTDVGDMIVTKRPEVDEADRAGFRTVFYLGQVLRVHYEAQSGAGGSSSKRTIEALDVHWCYPFFNGQPCDDVCRPWKLACAGLLHEWERCKRCIVCHDAVMLALKSGNKHTLADAKLQQTLHFQTQRAERLCYYDRVCRSAA